MLFRGVLLAGLLLAQVQPAPATTPAGAQAPAVLLFHEAWTRPMAQPMVQSSLGNAFLTLHIYGNATEIRKTMHPDRGLHLHGRNAIELGDHGQRQDVAVGPVPGRAHPASRRATADIAFSHVVIKTADGKFFASGRGQRGVDGLDRDGLHPQRSALAEPDDDRHAHERVESARAESQARADHSDVEGHA